jgi:hypothetical protein
LNVIAAPGQLGRSVALMAEFEDNEKCLSRIVGKTLTAVNFVLDYLVFQFDDSFLTVLTTVTVRKDESSSQPDDVSWRNSLCERITHTVTSVALEETQLNVNFSDKSAFAVSLSEPDRAGNEALMFQFPDGGRMQMLLLHIV